ncbi:MAG: M20/M25/M40 family metallo-hydrolase [Planctomycetes bacterium]|nr:M20/M25/M40 family metallo-hydrolase [Planctomycetota bacterium]
MQKQQNRQKLLHIKEIVSGSIEKRREEIIELAKSLVRIPSENIPPGGNEFASQKFICNFFTESGIESKLIDLTSISELSRHEAYYQGRDYTGRPNVIARYPGSGGGRSLLFSGHIDTMPVGDNKWSFPPFGADISNGRLYGRGAYDMKSGITAMMMAMKTIKECGIRLRGDLLFESVVDEEHAGCNGTLANRLIGFNADGVILPEPSNLKLYIAHKGFRIVHLSLKGKSGISFAGEELSNPVEYIGSLIECLKAFRKKRREAAPVPDIYKYDPDPVPVMLPKLQAGEFSLRIPMQIPFECKLEVYWQTMPGESQQEIEKDFFDFLDEWQKNNNLLPRDIVLEHNFSHRWIPGTGIDRNHPLVRVTKSVAEECLDTEVTVTGAPFPCDLFIFNLYGNMPGVILGPSGGNAHAADEFVYVEDIIKLTKIFSSLALRWCEL